MFRRAPSVPPLIHRSGAAAACVFACATAFAQAPSPAPQPQVQVQESPKLEGRKNQKVEKIHVEDDKVSIDETRYGGQTENIHVQPKIANVPGYDVQTDDLSRARPGDARNAPSSGGQPMWHMFSF